MSNVATSCSTCGAKYGGRAGHCNACHHTFSSDSAFDKHLISRVTAGCHDPGTLMTKGDPETGIEPRLVFTRNEARQLWQLASDGPGWWSAS